MTVFWVVAPCSLVEVYGRFAGHHVYYIIVVAEEYNLLSISLCNFIHFIFLYTAYGLLHRSENQHSQRKYASQRKKGRKKETLLRRLNNSRQSNRYYCFLWTWSIVQYSKTRPLRFGSWLCSHLQVKIPILLGPIEGTIPNTWTISVDQREPDKLLKPSTVSKRQQQAGLLRLPIPF
jgi:hypothetical protein